MAESEEELKSLLMKMKDKREKAHLKLNIQEMTIRTLHGTTNWFKIGNGVRQGCIRSPCLFNLYADYIMGNARLDEAQAGIKITGRNINNLRYTDDTALMAENKEEF